MSRNGSRRRARPGGGGEGGGLFTALAGSLGEPGLRTALALGADIVGVRGAACDGGRTGRVSVARVAALSAFVAAAVA